MVKNRKGGVLKQMSRNARLRDMSSWKNHIYAEMSACFPAGHR